MKYQILVTVLLDQDRGVGSAANRNMISISQIVLTYEQKSHAEVAFTTLCAKTPFTNTQRRVERLYNES